MTTKENLPKLNVVQDIIYCVYDDSASGCPYTVSQLEEIALDVIDRYDNHETSAEIYRQAIEESVRRYERRKRNDH